MRLARLDEDPNEQDGHEEGGGLEPIPHTMHGPTSGPVSALRACNANGSVHAQRVILCLERVQIHRQRYVIGPTNHDAQREDEEGDLCTWHCACTGALAHAHAHEGDLCVLHRPILRSTCEGAAGAQPTRRRATPRKSK